MPKTHSSVDTHISSTRIVFTSFLVNLIDVFLNLVVAVLTGSVIVASQGLQSIADLSSTGLILMGLKLSDRPPDSKHPFGYGRELYFWTLISGLIMFSVTATISFVLGWQRYHQPQPISHPLLAQAILVLGFFTNGYSLHQSSGRLLEGKRLSQLLPTFFQSPLAEIKVAFILDLTGTLTAILGVLTLLVSDLVNNSQLDGLGAMAIAIIFASLAFILLISTRELIIGRSASTQTTLKIRQAVLKIPEVQDILDLRTSLIGSQKILVNLEVHLQDHLTTDQIERVIDRIKARAKADVSEIHHIQVELETPDPPNVS